jgi:putative flippase GtrA
LNPLSILENPRQHRDVFWKLVRFLISGGLVTALGVGVYALVALYLRWHPQLGNLLAYLIAALIGYALHSKWSFRGHGHRDNMARTGSRFLVVSFVSLGLNSSWVWLLTEPLGLDPAWPILPMLFVTPLVTFTLNRQWVFR